MNLESLSTPELFAIYRKAQMILFFRLWWILPVLIGGLALISYLVYDVREEGIITFYLKYWWHKLVSWVGKVRCKCNKKMQMICKK